MANPYSVRHSWVVKSVAGAGVNTADLLPFQFGLVDPETWETISAEGFQAHNNVLFAVGSPHTGQNGDNIWSFPNNASRNISFKTSKIQGRQITGLRTATPSKSAKPFEIVIGYDGLNYCKNLAMECGKTYGLQLQVYGNAVGMTFPQGFVQDIIDISTACCDDCDTSCVAANICGTVVDELIEKINKAPWTSHFVRARKISEAYAGLDRIEYESYRLSLCDTGDAIALANVQNTYPTLKIKRVARLGTTSVYEFCQLESASAPASFTSTAKFTATCDTCPTGYTITDAYDIWYVTAADSITLASNANFDTALNTTSAVQGYTLMNTEGARKTFRVLVTAGTATTTPDAGVTIVNTGTQTAAVCTSDTTVTTAWVLYDSDLYRVTRDMCVQVEIPECDGVREADSDSILERVSELLADRDDIVLQTGELVVEAADPVATACRAIITLTQTNNSCLKDDCDTIEPAIFDNLPAVDGNVWTMCECAGWTLDAGTGCPVPPAAVTASCLCGIKLTGVFIDTATNDCIWDLCDYVNYEPVRFDVSFVEYDEKGIANLDCTKTVAPVMKVTNATSIWLSGQEVLRDIILTGNYRDELYMAANTHNGLRYRKAEGVNYGVDVDKFYYAVYINWNGEGNGRPSNTGGLGDRWELCLYFAEEDIAIRNSVVALLNGYTTSNGLNLSPVF